MLSRFDDFPIHQTPDPICVPASTDSDVYERYWFNGYSRAGDLYLGAGLALYPHLGIIDAHLSVVHEGEQHAFHVSARDHGDRDQLVVGPYRLEITEPMRSCRIVLEDNDTDFSCDLTFTGRTANIEEPRHTLTQGIRRVMDTTRFNQLGRWSGRLRFGGTELRMDPREVLATKDRSWGHRPVGGGDPRPAPPAGDTGGGIFFLWAPLHFDDHCSHYQLFEDRYGRHLYSVGAFLPVYDSIDDLPGIEDPGVEHMKHLEHDVTFEPDSRMVQSATLAMTSISDGRRHETSLEKLFTFRMKGIGYSHPEWGHGMWKGELAMASEHWSIDDIDLADYTNHHVQHLVRATRNGHTGIGVLEQNILGPYLPAGFTGFLDTSG